MFVEILIIIAVPPFLIKVTSRKSYFFSKELALKLVLSVSDRLYFLKREELCDFSENLATNTVHVARSCNYLGYVQVTILNTNPHQCVHLQEIWIRQPAKLTSFLVNKSIFKPLTWLSYGNELQLTGGNEDRDNIVGFQFGNVLALCQRDGFVPLYVSHQPIKYLYVTVYWNVNLQMGLVIWE